MLPSIILVILLMFDAYVVSKLDMVAWPFVVLRYVQLVSIGSSAESINPKNMVSCAFMSPVTVLMFVVGPRYMFLNWEATLV